MSQENVEIVRGTFDAMLRGDDKEATRGFPKARRAPVVFGLVPNGNVSVEGLDADGSRSFAPVANNVFEIASGDPVSVKFRSATGAAVTEKVGPITQPDSAAAPAG